MTVRPLPMLGREPQRWSSAPSSLRPGALAPTEVSWVVRNGIEQEVRAGQELIGHDEQADVVYVVVEGCLIASGGPAGLPFRVLPGEIAGDLPGAPPAGTVAAETDSTVLEIGRARIDAAVAQDPSFAGRLLEIAASITPQVLRAEKARLAASGPAETLNDESVRGLGVHELIEKMLRYDTA